LVASLTAHDKSGNHYNLIYEGWLGGANYSFMTVNDINSDGYNYDAVYVPTDNEVATNQFRFVSEGDKTRFMDYVHANSYLKTNKANTQKPIVFTLLGYIVSTLVTNMILLSKQTILKTHCNLALISKTL